MDLVDVVDDVEETFVSQRPLNRASSIHSLPVEFSGSTNPRDCHAQASKNMSESLEPQGLCFHLEVPDAGRGCPVVTLADPTPNPPTTGQPQPLRWSTSTVSNLPTYRTFPYSTHPVRGSPLHNIRKPPSNGWQGTSRCRRAYRTVRSGPGRESTKRP